MCTYSEAHPIGPASMRRQLKKQPQPPNKPPNAHLSRLQNLLRKDVIIIFPFVMGADKKEMKHFLLMHGQRRPMVNPKAKPAYPDSHHVIPACTFQETSSPSLGVTEMDLYSRCCQVSSFWPCSFCLGSLPVGTRTLLFWVNFVIRLLKVLFLTNKIPHYRII